MSLLISNVDSLPPFFTFHAITDLITSKDPNVFAKNFFATANTQSHTTPETNTPLIQQNRKFFQANSTVQFLCEGVLQTAVIVRKTWKIHWISTHYTSFLTNSSPAWITVNILSSFFTKLSQSAVLENLALSVLFGEEVVCSVQHLAGIHQQSQYLGELISERKQLLISAEIWDSKKPLFTPAEKRIFTRIQRIAQHSQALFQHCFSLSMHLHNMQEIISGDPCFTELAQNIPLETACRSGRLILKYMNSKNDTVCRIQSFLSLKFSITNKLEGLFTSRDSLQYFGMSFLQNETSNTLKNPVIPHQQREAYDAQRRKEALGYQENTLLL